VTSVRRRGIRVHDVAEGRLLPFMGQGIEQFLLAGQLASFNTFPRLFPVVLDRVEVR
jgi:hypothetical protein